MSNHVIAKIANKKNDDNYKIIVSNKSIYNTQNFNGITKVAYSPDHNLDEDSIFIIKKFSEQEFCIELIKRKFVSTEYDTFDKADKGKIEFICFIENSFFYFQKVTKSLLKYKKFIQFGDAHKLIESSDSLTINEIPDAIYVQNEDVLYFRKLRDITRIFKGIDSLYREATQEETQNFLNNDFINLQNGFDVNKVKTANRKRITSAMDIMTNYDTLQKNEIFKTIKEFCPNLTDENNRFNISNENDLKLLLYGIQERFYITPVSKERRIANSVETF